MSREFFDILQSKLYKSQAKKAIALGLTNKSEALVHKFHDYILKNIYSCIDSSLSSADYEHPALDILKKHDEKFKTEYYITLCKYPIKSVFTAKLFLTGFFIELFPHSRCRSDFR